MGRFFGAIGYAQSVENAPGVWEDVITERKLYGDVLQATRRLVDGEGLNQNLTLTNRISVVADAFASENFFNIRYVEWAGARWTVSSVEDKRPRLILSLGEVYNGPTP